MAARDSGGAARRLRARHAVAAAVALVAGALLASLAFLRPRWSGGPALTPRFEPRELVERLPSHLHWLIAFAGLAALLPSLRALVWRLVMPRPPPRYRDAYHATALGALVHNTVPGKLGPLAAAWALARMERRPFTPAVSAQLVSKLLELGAIVLLGALAAAARAPGPALREVVIAGAVLFVVLSSGAIALALGAPGAAARIERRLPRAGAALAALGEGVTGAADHARLAAALGAATLPALCAATAYSLPLRAMGVEESAAGGALLLAVVAFGQLTPGLPIGAGVYWSLAAWGARQLGVSAADAAAVAILTHAATVGVNIAVGGISAVTRRAAVAELFRRRREVAHLGARAPAASSRTRAPT